MSKIKFVDKYKVEYLDYKLYTSSWGVMDYKGRALHIEALINERYEQGYKLKELLVNPDAVGYLHHTFIFEKMED